MGRIFGTDGARGIANTEISCSLAMNIGMAFAMVMNQKLERQPVIVIGKDPRISSDMLEAAISAGLASVGAHVVLGGTMPTPAVAHLVSKSYFDGGVMLSASHNSFEYNGIKLFGTGGFKLTDEEELLIEEIVLDKSIPYAKTWGKKIGTIKRNNKFTKEYAEYISRTIGSDISGIKVLLDCSNGSACTTAYSIFAEAGAEVEIINAEPDGININKDCGSTHINHLAEIVRERKGEFDAAFAFDGDADRCIAVDENGDIVDGDKIIGILATELKKQGKLRGNSAAVTVMSNIGLFKYFEGAGIDTVKTKVGDRYVLAEMLEKGLCIGGEQSGHVILMEHMITGDGQLTAIQLLDVIKTAGRPLSAVASEIKIYPQVMKNITADHVMKAVLDTDKGARILIDKAEEKLLGNGRILVRASGTEPLIRVMIEGEDIDEIENIAQQLAEDLKARLSDNEDMKNAAD